MNAPQHKFIDLFPTRSTAGAVEAEAVEETLKTINWELETIDWVVGAL